MTRGAIERRSRRSFVIALALALILPGQALRAQSLPADAPVALPREELVIETQSGERHHFTVELAVKPNEQARGLMFRRQLPADHGMLFVYPRSGEIQMWMKNTLIPLDMIFIARDGTIARIAERTVPLSLQTIAAGEPVLAVLEVNGGTASRLGIGPGDRVLHRAFGSEG
jgi:uncharacterized membrane protein (UPF0127 family)